MQFQNKRLWIVVWLFVMLVGAGLWLILSSHPAEKNPGTQGEHVDPLSHEVVSSPPGKAPDKYGSSTNLPLYLGFDKLLNYGISSTQLNDIQQAFYSYSLKQAQPVSQVSIDVDHIDTRHDPSDPNSSFTVLFNVQFNGDSKLYQAVASYKGIDDIDLTLSQSGKMVYDSGVISPGE